MLHQDLKRIADEFAAHKKKYDQVNKEITKLKKEMSKKKPKSDDDKKAAAAAPEVKPGEEKPAENRVESKKDGRVEDEKK